MYNKIIKSEGEICMSQVYCTDCRHFYIDEKDFIPKCKYEEECDIRDCEDSRSLEERPCYEERVD